jgi:hypothetical protein
MFASANLFDNLGKPSAINYNSYTSPLKSPTIDVSLIPVKNPSGNVQYISVIEEDETLILPEDMRVDLENDENDASSSQNTRKMAQMGPIHAAASHDDSDDENENKRRKKDVFYLGKDSINAFYIGSVTVVGLYILFRILQKTK